MTIQQKVIAIDGPSASGKGTIASLLAKKIGFNYLDSGAIYRICALATQNKDISWDDETALVNEIKEIDIQFVDQKIYLAAEDVTEQIRQEQVGLGASQIAKFPLVREALLTRQRAFLTEKGLVADGRDMGSVVFPNAMLKVFLTASAEVRAKRRFLQLEQMDKTADFEVILKDIEARDFADQNRAVAPLKHYPDAYLLDGSDMTIEETVDTIYSWYVKS